MKSDQRYYYLAFSAFEEGIGPYRFKLLVEHYKTAKNAWSVPQKELVDVGIPANIASKFTDFKNKFNLDSYIKEMEQMKVSFLTLEDEAYPYLLKQISDAPIVLYIKGNLDCVGYNNFSSFAQTSKKILAVVGTRKITAYGREVTEKIVGDLVTSGFTIVSGMALGVDTVAHQTTIKNHGQTIAVLGCGVDVIYPPQNRQLYFDIIESGGCIVSEMPLNHWATKGTFPARNRIISGLSRGVLMTEGAIDSGALITCSYAGEQGRDVFAVPGLITSSLSEGTLSLLKKGAKLVTGAEDILEEFGMEKPPKNYNRYNNNNYNDYTAEEKEIIDLLQQENLTADDIIKNTGQKASAVNTLLSLLEIKGYIKNCEGKYKLN